MLSKQTLSITLAVVALVVLAGCAGTGGPTDTATETTAIPETTTSQETTTSLETTTSPETTASPETTTSRETTTGGATSTNTTQDDASNLPPGVSESGVENATALVEAHTQSVLERGAVTTGKMELNGTSNGEPLLVSLNETVRLAPGATEMQWTVLGNTTQGNETTRLNERYYANESTYFSLVERGGDVRVRAVDRSPLHNDSVLGAATKAYRLNATLSNVSYTVADVTERDGRTLTTLETVNGTYNGTIPGIVEFDATLTVSESGRVLSMTRSWTTETDGATNQYEETATWSNATPVERPEWVANATSVTASQDTRDDTTETATESISGATAPTNADPTVSTASKRANDVVPTSIVH